jgi:K+-transporting ATPase A subunit
VRDEGSSNLAWLAFLRLILTPLLPISSALSAIFFLSFLVTDIMSTKHFFDTAEGLVDKAERGAVALNPALR